MGAPYPPSRGQEKLTYGRCKSPPDEYIVCPNIRRRSRVKHHASFAPT